MRHKVKQKFKSDKIELDNQARARYIAPPYHRAINLKILSSISDALGAAYTAGIIRIVAPS
jgi:hypothetical protein